MYIKGVSLHLVFMPQHPLVSSPIVATDHKILLYNLLLPVTSEQHLGQSQFADWTQDFVSNVSCIFLALKWATLWLHDSHW